MTFAQKYEKIGGKLVQVNLKPTIRLNTLRASANIPDRLAAKNVKLSKIPFAKHGYRVESSPFSLGASLEYLRGYITPQEAASQMPVHVLDPKPRDRILDMAAAPGVKTSQIAQWMENKGELVAIEKNNLRVPSLKNNLERLGVTNCIAFNTDASKVQDWRISFDKILIDAPCMGNYMQSKDWLGKNMGADFKKNNPTQKSLLAAAVPMLKKNGSIVYATCSLEPEENEMIIDWALRELPVRCVETGLQIGDPGLTSVFGKNLTKEVSNCRRFWPYKTQTEGFFIAKLVKK